MNTGVGSMSGAKGRTLIVDDEEDMRILLRATIEVANQGLSVAAEAGGGEEGLAQWREHRPDIVLLDQRMPDLTGLEVAERILAEAPEQAIVLFSAYLDDDMRATATTLGVRECLSKSDFAKVPEVLWRCAGND
jgi:YesN/AraC family two-component response regulator